MDPMDPMEPPASQVVEVSKTTLPVAGIKVDIYGLLELPPTASSVSCLWLHHGRGGRKEKMAARAHMVVSSYYGGRDSTTRQRGLIAVAFDQRNHGSRLVDGAANKSWREGNGTHAQDMFDTLSGTAVDTMHLIDVLEGHLFGAGNGPGAMSTTTDGPGSARRRRIDQNLVLGVSLGGHSAWQLLFAEPRITAGVVVIGCPDYTSLLKDRARKSKLQTYSKDDDGAAFVGSKDFPAALINACKKFDPKGIVFGTDDVPSAKISAAEQDRIRGLLDSRIRGKRFQIISGGVDKLVPYKAGAPFLKFFKDAVGGWYRDGNVYVEDKVYPEAGHTFNEEMAKDALRFIIDTVDLAGTDDDGRSTRVTSAKI